MAFSDPIPLTNTNGPVGSSFTIVKTDGTGTDRFDTLTSLAAPRKMNLRHSSSKVKDVGDVDRHLLQFTETKIRSADGVPVTAIVNLTVTVPRDGTFSAAELKGLIDYVSIFLDATNVPKFLRGER